MGDPSWIRAGRPSQNSILTFTETTVTMLSEGRGIVPRIVDQIFTCIRESDQAAVSYSYINLVSSFLSFNESLLLQAFTVSVSMLEVYDDKVRGKVTV